MAEIRRTYVAAGVSYIEIQAANLRILCGCPADTVKNLIKRGIIVAVEENDFSFETGPTVILLSDVMVQNGRFANMTEFPVLQMLYRQGLIVPNHPNNTGQKPLLMGSQHQLTAQLKYIRRGNYGLVSADEIMACGYSAEEANELMRMKLKFAFGKISPAEDLVDTLGIAQDKVEIRDGVTIERKGANIFDISYGEETVIIDLNLADHERYDSPYRLGMHDIERGYFSVIHSGDGDGWDVNRPAMGAILTYQGKIYLIDAGPNVVQSLVSLGIGVNEIEGLFHTHSHDDHFAGLTNIMRSDHRIKYYTTPLVRACVTRKLAALTNIGEDDFTEYFDVRDINFSEWNDIDGLEVMPIMSPHPVETSMFVFRTMSDSGYKSYAHFADVVSSRVLQGMVTDKEDEPGVSQAFYDRTMDSYHIPADLKRVDIGGGMIHGDAEDFRGDRSTKIILSHTALNLTEEQKEIGSGASFGTADILIPTYQDFTRRDAFKYLTSYFPEVEQGRLRVLLNNKVERFNPETIILHEGESIKFIYLILTGNVEMIHLVERRHTILSSGGLAGEEAVLYNEPSLHTVRASNFVWTLKIPCNLYLEFIRRHELLDKLRSLQKYREFLQGTWLFEEAISYGVINGVAAATGTITFNQDDILETPDPKLLYLIQEGRAMKLENGVPTMDLHGGDCFGEESLFSSDNSVSLQFGQESQVMTIPFAALDDIPIVKWKLFELNQKI